MKPASPHLIVGLSCQLVGFKNLEELVNRYYSPLNLTPGNSPKDKVLAASAKLAQILEAAFLDTGLNEIPRHTAVFISLPRFWDGTELIAGLKNHRAIAAADLTVLVSEDSGLNYQEALSWLDRGECDYAMVVACGESTPNESAQASAFIAAAVLVASSAAAARDAIRAYASTARHDFVADDSINPLSVGLIELSSNQANHNDELLADWLALRSGKTGKIYFEHWDKHDSLCFVSSLAMELSDLNQNLAQIVALISSALALYLRILPSSDSNLNLGSSKLLVHAKQIRPWIHPVSPAEIPHPRRAFVPFLESGILLTEFVSDIDKTALRNLQKQSTELFVYAAENVHDLRNELKRAVDNFNLVQAPLSERAFLTNCVFHSAGFFKLAIVAKTEAELQELLAEAIVHLDEKPEVSLAPIANRPSGIFYSGKPAIEQGKLVFVLPGLGAAYPGMLADLCYYYPEVRQAFDFVERLALKLGDQILPSRAVFPLTSAGAQSSQAMLATMDSAVITLLLAEWALFALLKKLGINPDIFLGCSTGEFAALTMSDSIDLFQASELFYKLSTHVSRSINLAELSALRSLRVSASYENVLSPILQSIEGPIYMSADMSDSCVLLSGGKAVMDKFASRLKKEKIDYLVLPIAIPYHTSLVAGKVSEQNSEVQKLKMVAPKVESWSCSTESRYPEASEKLRQISTGLFEKPIKLRSTLLQMYDEAGARTFVELGPKGGLVPYITEVLSGRDHLAVAVNLPGKSGIDQLNAMLAIMVCNGTNVNLHALYERRVAASRSCHEEPVRFLEDSYYSPLDEVRIQDISLDLGMELHRSDDFEAETLQISNSLYDFMQWSVPNYNPQEAADMELETTDWAPFFTGTGMSDEVMIAYLSTMQEFHHSLMNSQEKLMMAYLLGTDESATAGPVYRSQFPFIPHLALQSFDDCYCIELLLSTELQPFLLDHAIGGNVYSHKSESAAVHLLPLMVALEIMAEGAKLLYPHMDLIRITDVRAYKRIRLDDQVLRLNLELRASKPNCVDARICMQEFDDDDSSLLASCQLEFSTDDESSPESSQFPIQDQRTSKFSPHNLYGAESMFHGPRMQAVQSIDIVSKRTIGGLIANRNSDDWFINQTVGSDPSMLVDPLRLDNASQFVLYQMFEHDMPATALLPFHIESIEFFRGYHDVRSSQIRSNAFLRSMSLRGTEAQVELTDLDGRVLAKINEINSRAIVLSPEFRQFIADPRKLLCKTIDLGRTPDTVITSILLLEMPTDATTLDWMTDYLLTPDEQVRWKKVGRTDKRRLDWLSGRVAAKDAVRVLAKQKFGIELRPADILIQKSPAGSIEAVLPHFDLEWNIQISLSHCASMAVAIAEISSMNCQSGIDVESIVQRDEGFDELAFCQSEREWLTKFPAAEHPMYMSLLWTAKEAAAKACGSGLAGNPKLFEMQEVNLSKNEFIILAKVDTIGQKGLYTCSSYWLKESNVCLSFVCSYNP